MVFLSHTDFRLHQIFRLIGFKTFDAFTIALYHSIAQGLWLLFLLRKLNRESEIIEKFEYFHSIILIIFLFLANFLRIRKKGQKNLFSDFENRPIIYRVLFDIFALIYLFFPFVYTLISGGNVSI